MPDEFGELTLMTVDEARQALSKQQSVESKAEETPAESQESNKSELPDEVQTLFTPASKNEFKEVTDNTETVTEPNTEKQEKANNEDETLSLWAKALAEKGIFNQDDIKDFKGSVEDLIKLQQQTIEKQAEDKLEQWKQTLPPATQKILGLIQEGVDANYAAESVERLEIYEAVTEDALSEDENLRKDLIKQDLLHRGYNEAKAEKFLQKIVDLGDDEEEAKEALQNLKSFESGIIEAEKNRAKEYSDSFKKRQEQYIQSLSKGIEEMKELYPGYEANENHRKALLNSYTQAAGKNAAGQPINTVQVNRDKNPAEWDKAIHVLNMLGVLKINDKGSWEPDFSHFGKIVKTKAAEELKNKLKINGSSNGKGTPVSSGESTSLLEALDAKYGRPIHF